jgi:Recombinase
VTYITVRSARPAGKGASCPHRSGQAWTLFTVRAILANPRYTGRQVWNRQPTSHDLIDAANTGLGHRQVQRWAQPDGWVISARPARRFEHRKKGDRSPDKSPGTGGSLSAGDIVCCPETDAHIQIACPRTDLNPHGADAG